MQYKEASRFRAAASAAAAGAAPQLNEADRAYRQMVSDHSISILPLLRCVNCQLFCELLGLSCELLGLSCELLGFSCELFGLSCELLGLSFQYV